MSTIPRPGSAGGMARVQPTTSYSSIGSATYKFFRTNTSVMVSYQTAAGVNAKNYSLLLPKKYKLNVAKNLEMIPNSLHGLLQGTPIVDRSGKLYMNVGGETEAPEIIGAIDYVNLELSIDHDFLVSGTQNQQLNVTHLTGRAPLAPVFECTFKTPGAPIRTGSLSIKATTLGGDTIVGESDADGNISSTHLKGYVNYKIGVGWLSFGKQVSDLPEYRTLPWYKVENVVNGMVWYPIAVDWASVMLNCVITSHLPLDATLLGLDPVRLPADGKVPIFRDGDIILVHNTQAVTLPNPIEAGQVVNIGRTNLSLIELYDATGLVLPDLLYTADLATGDVTMATPLSLAGYTQPLVAMHRIEDMLFAADVQITGHIGVISQLTHNYPKDTSFVSSVITMGDMQARCYNEFHQVAWTNVWSDTRIGSEPLANYDFVNYPIIVDNKSGIKERFALIHTSSTTVNVIGEHLGIIDQFSTMGEIAPINPNTGEPYFRMAPEGWGDGWSTGYVTRLNFDGCNYPLWAIRTTLQGAASVSLDKYTIQVRGDSS